MVSEKPSAGTPDLFAYFSMEFMLSESAPDLFGRTWQCGRRSAQRLASDLACRLSSGPALPQGYFSPGKLTRTERNRLFTRTTTRTVAHHAVAPTERGVAAVGDRLAWLLGLAARLAGPAGRVKTLPAG